MIYNDTEKHILNVHLVTLRRKCKLISEKELEKIKNNPEELKTYMDLLKKSLVGMIKEQEETAATREKYARESKREPFNFNNERFYRLDLHLKGTEAIKVINLLKGLDKRKVK